MRTHRFDPDYVVPTSEILREWLAENGHSPQVAAAKAGGTQKDKVRAVLERVLADGKVDTYEASVLTYVTDISMEFWQAFEHNYRVGLAEGKKVLT
jgi:hypothetical protein